MFIYFLNDFLFYDFKCSIFEKLCYNVEKLNFYRNRECSLFNIYPFLKFDKKKCNYILAI